MVILDLILLISIVGLVVYLIVSNKKSRSQSTTAIPSGNVSITEIPYHAEYIYTQDTDNYFIYCDDHTYGPFSYMEIVNEYPILSDTLITTDRLNGVWYEANQFAIFQSLLAQSSDDIDEYGGGCVGEDGTITRNW